jgi:hypothetical protein
VSLLPDGLLVTAPVAVRVAEVLPVDLLTMDFLLIAMMVSLRIRFGCHNDYACCKPRAKLQMLRKET